MFLTEEEVCTDPNDEPNPPKPSSELPKEDDKPLPNPSPSVSKSKRGVCVGKREDPSPVLSLNFVPSTNETRRVSALVASTSLECSSSPLPPDLGDGRFANIGIPGISQCNLGIMKIQTI